MTVAEAVALVETRLGVAGVDTPRLDAQMLVAHALEVERSWVLAHGTDPFEASEALEPLCERREAREPLAYILGWREFYGRRFIITPDVLIPRQETETLVEAALAEIRGVEAPVVFDACTGSGCVAITIAVGHPGAHVWAGDISPAALKVAEQNNLAHGNRVLFGLSDLLKEVDKGRFDVITANPPYVATGDALPPEVRDFEPHSALYAGPDGLAIYRRLAEEAHEYLRPGGALLVEIGDGQSEAVQRLFEGHGWHIERVVNDLTGTPRVIVAKPLIVA